MSHNCKSFKVWSCLNLYYLLLMLCIWYINHEIISCLLCYLLVAIYHEAQAKALNCIHAIFFDNTVDLLFYRVYNSLKIRFNSIKNKINIYRNLCKAHFECLLSISTKNFTKITFAVFFGNKLAFDHIK